MKPRFLSVLLGVFCSFGVLHAQISENFDGNALSSTWKGDVSKFEIEDGKLVLSDEDNAGTNECAEDGRKAAAPVRSRQNIREYANRCKDTACDDQLIRNDTVADVRKCKHQQNGADCAQANTFQAKAVSFRYHPVYHAKNNCTDYQGPLPHSGWFMTLIRCLVIIAKTFCGHFV